MQLVGYFYTNLVIDFTLGLLCDYSSIYLGFFRGVDGPSQSASALLSSVSFSGGRLIKYIIKILTDYFKPNTDSLYYLSRRHNWVDSARMGIIKLSISLQIIVGTSRPNQSRICFSSSSPPFAYLILLRLSQYWLHCQARSQQITITLFCPTRTESNTLSCGLLPIPCCSSTGDELPCQSKDGPYICETPACFRDD